MPWKDQTPPAHDVVVTMSLPRNSFFKANVIEVDKLPDGDFRVTHGNLFASEELGRCDDLERVMRGVHALVSAKDRHAATEAHRALTELGQASPAPGR